MEGERIAGGINQAVKAKSTPEGNEIAIKSAIVTFAGESGSNSAERKKGLKINQPMTPDTTK